MKYTTGEELIYVIDSSNIEARMLAWESGHEALLQQFRNKEDVYANFAEQIYARPINKTTDPIERFIGKTCVLGLGYQVGWRKLQGSLATSNEAQVILDDVEAQRIVQLYRSVNDPIRQFWRQCENAIVDMYLGNNREWGALTIHKNCLVMPNGMALQYHGLRPVDVSEDNASSGGWEYWNGKFWTNIYGGKLCLAEGTQVLTKAGWQAIETIQPDTEVWDGIEWVSCDGNIYNGDKPVIELAGVTMTPDHEVLTNEGWKTASQSQGHYREESRLPDSPGIRWERWEEIPMEIPLRMRGGDDHACDRVQQTGETGGRSLVRMQAQENNSQTADQPRDVPTPCLCSVEIHAGQVLAADSPSVGELRRQGNNSLRQMATVIPGILGGHGGDLRKRPDTRAQEQQSGVLPGQLCLDRLCRTGQQQAQLDQDRGSNREAAFGEERNIQIDDRVSPSSWLALGQATTPAQPVQPVYDLVNCGPRNRFVVRDANGNPMIVHNCENITQALSRIVLFEQMLDINDLLTPHGGRIVLNVHDEAIAVGPSYGAKRYYNENGRAQWVDSTGADEIFAGMTEIMGQAPSWCPDLPLDSEGGYDFMYSL